jgi:hypothetical protein
MTLPIQPDDGAFIADGRQRSLVKIDHCLHRNPMTLTLRPTGLRNSGAFAHLADWSVIENGEDIGRIYQVHAAPPSRPRLVLVALSDGKPGAT